jgi:hypothetical protein
MKHIHIVHIDKLRVVGPCVHPPIGKTWYRFGDDGTLQPVGSDREAVSLGDQYGAVQLRSQGLDENGIATRLQIECCPPLVLQRHNWAGHSSLLDYTVAIFEMFTDLLGINILPEDLAKWRRGAVQLMEVHLTANFRCPPGQVEHVIDEIDRSNRTGKHRDGVGILSLGWTAKRRSKYHTLSLYDKQVELEQRFGTHSAGSTRAKLLKEAKDSLRVELKLFSQLLAKRKLNWVYAWDGLDVESLYFALLAKYDLEGTIRQELTDDEQNMLTVKENNVYRLWLGGVDVRDQFKSRTTVAKHISSIKEKTGINVGSHRRPASLPSVELADLFSKSNAIIVPAWLVESNSFWKPARRGIPITEWRLRRLGDCLQALEIKPVATVA